jgi:AcrR family transcriptional regulator
MRVKEFIAKWYKKVKSRPCENRRCPWRPKRRGRPRAYEPEVALGKALDLFRKDGFAATSLDDLSAATGMNRPSLYGAFGDKRELYIKSYQRYRDDARARWATSSATSCRSASGWSASTRWRSTSICPANPVRAAASR